MVISDFWWWKLYEISREWGGMREMEIKDGDKDSWRDYISSVKRRSRNKSGHQIESTCFRIIGGRACL